MSIGAFAVDRFSVSVSRVLLCECLTHCVCVAAAWLAAAALALDDFYFSRHPQNLVVREGGSVDLECMVSNTSFIRFYWQLEGETVDNSSRRFQRGSDLHITRVDRRLDGGHFTCIAMNVTTGFSLTSLAASLNIQCEYRLLSASVRTGPRWWSRRGAACGDSGKCSAR